MTPSIKPVAVLSGTLLIGTAAVLATAFQASLPMTLLLVLWGMLLTLAAFGDSMAGR